MNRTRNREQRIPHKKRKIAVMGGSFNPITRGHLELGEAVLNRMPEMEEVWLMPAYRHPFHKHDEYAEHRVQMLRMVETPRIRYFSYEIDHKLTGETYVTFHRLLKDPEFKDIYDFHMVVGSDCVLEFDDKWKRADLLAEMVTFIIVPRPGYDLEGYDGLLSHPPHIQLRDADMPDVSSTRVRNRIRRGESIEGLVPEPVRCFIRENHLYEENQRSRSGESDGDSYGSNPCEKPVSQPEPVLKTPLLSVNMAACAIREETLKVLLVKRKQSPCSTCWAIPGDYLNGDEKENLEETAAARLEEATGLTEIYFEQLKTYGDVDPNSGDRVITTAYFALIPYEKPPSGRMATAGDGTETKWFSLRDFPRELRDLQAEIAFGHDRILQDLLIRIRGKISYTPIAFELLPDQFTWPELRRVFEIVLGKTLDATNFKRKIRSVYKIRDLKSRRADKSVGRPPNRLRFEGVKDIYI